jgi:hypothetical protein
MARRPLTRMAPEYYGPGVTLTLQTQFAPGNLHQEKVRRREDSFLAVAYGPGSPMRYTHEHAILGVSNNHHPGVAHVPCLSATRDVRHLGSHGSNRQRNRIRFGCPCIVRGRGVFACTLYLQVRVAWFSCKEYIRPFWPESVPFHAVQFGLGAF